MDGVSAATSILAVVQITAQVVQICQTYYVAVRDARKDITRLCTQFNTFQEALIRIADIADTTQPVKLSIVTLLSANSDFIKGCKDQVGRVLEKLQKTYSSGHISNFGIHALKWPYDKREIEKVLIVIHDYQSTIQTAIGADLLPLALQTHKNVSTLYNDAVWRDIENWLAAPDPSINFQSARKRCQPGTGKWLLETDEFQKWKRHHDSVFWLSGSPGSGKTILSSSIVGYITELCKTQEKSVLGYYFFDYRDEAKRDPERLVRSLLIQLSQQHGTIPKAILDLYSEHGRGLRQPGLERLLVTLHQAIKLFRQVFLVMDALDECNKHEELMRILGELAGWDRTHLLITSRQIKSIEEELQALEPTEIRLQANLVNDDIKLYVSHTLENDTKLKRWPLASRKLIEEALLDKAQGMFRWVACQFETLRKCVKLPSLEQTLNSLPSSLEETYDRILQALDPMYSEDSLNVLRWMAFSYRPLTLNELNDAQATQCGNSPIFNHLQRLPDPRDLLVLCSTFGIINKANSETRLNPTAEDFITFSHYSIKEYLTSRRIRVSPAKYYSLTEDAGHHELSRACLTYLLQDALRAGPCRSREEMTSRLLDLPFLHYAAAYWPFHANLAKSWDSQLETLIKALFEPGNRHFLSWVQLLLLRQRHLHVYSLSGTPTPLYYASSFGIEMVVKWLLENGADPNGKGGALGGTPLHAALFRGHPKIARILLEAGAIPGIQDSTGMSALELGKYVIKGRYGQAKEAKLNEDGTTYEASNRVRELLDIISGEAAPEETNSTSVRIPRLKAGRAEIRREFQC